MLIQSINGTIMEVVKVEPIVEKREEFNGTVHRRVAVAKDMTQNISGILFTMPSTQFGMSAFGPDDSKLLVANLKRDVVEELMESILKKGYAELSGYSYQSGYDITKLSYDNGKSDPYYLWGYSAIMDLEHTMTPNPFATCGTPSFGNPWEDGEDSDDEPENAEQMRREIYAMSDKYTISQLANMNKDELSDILKGIESQF